MSQQTNPRPLVGATDSLIALMIAVAAVVWAHQQRMSMGGLGEFLKIRVTSLNASFSIVFAVLWQQCMQALGLYRRSSELLRPMLSSAAGVGLMTVLLGLYLEARRADGPVRQVLVAFFIAAFCYRMVRIFLSNPLLGGRIADPEQVVIVGSGRRAAKAWRELRTQDHGAKTLLGFVDDRHPSLMPPDIAGRLLGRIDDLPGYLLRNAVDELIVAAPARSCYDMTQRAVAMAEAAGVRVVCLNDLYSLIHDRKLRQRAAVFLELVPRNEAHQFSEAVKRTLDIVVAAALSRAFGADVPRNCSSRQAHQPRTRFLPAGAVWLASPAIPYVEVSQHGAQCRRPDDWSGEAKRGQRANLQNQE